MIFKEFNKIVEAGKKPVSIKWKKTTSKWSGIFNIDSTTFNISITKNNEYCDNIEVYEFKFTRSGSTKMVNDFKYPFRVVPTIKKALETFITEVNPEVIGFVGNKDDLGRVKMYEKNAKYYSDKFDYKLLLDKSTDYYAFILYTTDELEDCAKELSKHK